MFLTRKKNRASSTGYETLPKFFKAVLNYSAQQAQNVLTHLQFHFLAERYKIGKPDHGNDLESNCVTHFLINKLPMEDIPNMGSRLKKVT